MCQVYLLRCAEDVSIILAEPANTSEASQRSGALIAMQRPEVGPSQGKLPPRANPMFKHETGHKKAQSGMAKALSAHWRTGMCM